MKENVQKFFAWFSKLGGYSAPSYEELVEIRLIDRRFPHSSIKDRAAEFKKKYNHKFEHKHKHKQHE
jgi:hypothetical protein